jgi:hypothetical protein
MFISKTRNNATAKLTALLLAAVFLFTLAPAGAVRVRAAEGNDISDFSWDMYKADVILNRNADFLSGLLNPYATLQKYLIGYESVADFCIETLQSDVFFVLAKDGWESSNAIFDITTVTEGVLSIKDYYIEAILSILDVETDNADYLGSLDDNVAKQTVKLAESFAKAGGNLNNIDLSKLDVTTQLTEEAWFKEWSNSIVKGTCWKNTEVTFNAISFIIKGVTTVEEFVNKLAIYATLIQISSDKIAVIEEMYERCSANDFHCKDDLLGTKKTLLLSALTETRDIVRGAYEESLFVANTGYNAIFNYGANIVMKEIWKEWGKEVIKKHIVSKIAVGAGVSAASATNWILLANSIGRASANLLFDTE